MLIINISNHCHCSFYRLKRFCSIEIIVFSIQIMFITKMVVRNKIITFFPIRINVLISIRRYSFNSIFVYDAIIISSLYYSVSFHKGIDNAILRLS